MTPEQRAERARKAARARWRKNQEALAGKAGIHGTYVGSVERAERNVSVDNICRLTWALGVECANCSPPGCDRASQ